VSDRGKTILAAAAIRKGYPSGERRIEVLRGVDLQVAEGDTLSIRGESGSGKTTLLNVLAGLETSEGGDLAWAGERVADLSVDGMAGRRAVFVGMIFQAYYLIPELNALENVLMSARIRGRMGKPERQRAAELLERVGLRERGHHLPSQLSGGERQRVAVARALMNRPKLVLADEPTGNLDENTGSAIIDLLLEICTERRTALILVTHNLHHARRTARQAELHLGVLEEL
jgi:predicted ABC-type transport system involved in lysophospholipase L1 biosynthesis ATPase subunit